MSDEVPGAEGLPGGFGNLLEKAREIQQRIAETQAKLGDETATGESGGGMVRVTVNGRQEVLSVEIEPLVIDPGERDMLQDLVTAATNQALRAIRDKLASEMGRLTGGLSIPGLF